MRKIILIAIFILCSISSEAQEHFTFRGIPIDGSMEQMGARLLELGYKPIGRTNAYSGKFIEEDCTIFLWISDYTKNMYAIAINLDIRTKWITLKHDYNKIKKLYSEKYGDPSISHLSFDDPYYEGDGYELSAIKLNKCTYSTIWDLKNGFITLFISDDCSIIIAYLDKINHALDQKAKEDAMKNEI